MTNYFVDSTTGDNGNDGLTTDTAWYSVPYASQAGGLVFGDIVWIRRTHHEIIPQTYTVTNDGFADNPISYIGWPRNSSSITSATWTQGSSAVDNIVGTTMVSGAHLGRYITAPNGEDYLITRVFDSDTISIERNYNGATVTGVNGACTIKADEDYDLAQAIDDSTFTIKLSAWSAEPDNLPIIDFNNQAYYWQFSTDMCHLIRNIHFMKGNNGSGMIWNNICKTFEIVGCIFENYNNVLFYVSNGYAYIERTIGIGQRALLYHITSNIKNCSFYDSAGYSLVLTSGDFLLENVNLGIEIPNNSGGLYINYHTRLRGRDVSIQNSGDEVYWYYASPYGHISIENFNKEFGVHKTLTAQGTLTKTPVVAGSGDPEKRTNGSNNIIEVLYNRSSTTHDLKNPYDKITPTIFEQEFEIDTNIRNYRFYVQTDTEIIPSGNLWIEAEYVDSYTDDTLYSYSKVRSDESISVRTGADDWSQYLEVTNIASAVNSKVRIKCFCSYYHATAKIWIDPKVEIS